MTTKNLTLIILCFLASLNLQAQNNFLPGALLKQNGDTIPGLINYTADRTFLFECSFKKDTNAVVQVFTTADLDGYYITGEKYFIAKTIEYKGSSTRVFFRMSGGWCGQPVLYV